MSWMTVLDAAAVGTDESYAGFKAMCDSGNFVDAGNAVADQAYSQWRVIKEIDDTLPEVCDAGQECRDKIFNEAKQTMAAEWAAVIQQVCVKFGDSWTKTKKFLENGYKEEFVCEPECYCEEIEQTYIDHVRLYREIESEITDIETEIKPLVAKQADVLVNCPDYAETKYEVPAEYLD